MFTVSIDSLPLPNMPLPELEGGRISNEQTFLEEDEALDYAERLVGQGFIVRIEAPNRDDVILCTGLIEVKYAKRPAFAALQAEDDMSALNRRRRSA